MRYREALNQALREEMQQDDKVFLMGEDIGVFQGAFKVTAGLLEEFGEKRVRDTPISEGSFTGMGVGAAMAGLRPIVGISRMAITAERAAETLASEHDIEAEVIDPRTLRPLDLDTILESVRKTNRAVIVEEGWPHGGVGANLAALIQEQAFDHLDAPVERVTGADVPMPYSKPLEQAAFPPAVCAGPTSVTSTTRPPTVSDRLPEKVSVGGRSSMSSNLNGPKACSTNA